MKRTMAWAMVAGMTLAGVGCAHHAAPGQALVGVSVPVAVRATLLRETFGGPILSLERDTDDGEVTFEARAIIGGKPYEIEIDADGRLVSKELAEECACCKPAGDKGSADKNPHDKDPHDKEHQDKDHHDNDHHGAKDGDDKPQGDGPGHEHHENEKK